MKAAIMGYGTIGSGVARVLSENRDIIKTHALDEIELKYVLDVRDFPGDPINEKIVHDYKVIVDDPEVKLVVETMGGVEPAYTFVDAMLRAGKNVATSNKALVAEKGAELIATAKKNNVNFMFEASVGGGIPIIRVLLKCVTGDEIESIYGIVNGTTNYMLTQMTEKDAAFDEVLKEAQSLGYAEKDPTADVEGFDAARKIAILTSLAAERQVDFQDFPTEGITKIEKEDIAFAKKNGMKVKLLAAMDKTGDSYFVRVAPFLVSPESPLFAVDGVMNAVFVKGNMLGDSMYYGSGAGSLPTASAVVGDLVEEARHVNKHVDFTWEPEKITLLDPEEQSFRYYVRKGTECRITDMMKEKDFLSGDGADCDHFIRLL